VIPDTGFYHVTAGKIDDVDAAPPTALTDASLTTWVHPTDGTDDLYYPKGSLAGFMLDILIRNASDNRESLDSVMRTVYNATYKHQRGFSGVDWWGAASRAAGGVSFAEFNRRYIDGREPFPWDSILPLAGLRLVPDSIREPRLGILSMPDTGGRIRVMQVEPGSAAAQAGVQPGDVLVSIGDIPVASLDFGQQFRARYGNGSQTPPTIPVVIRRSGQSVTLRVPLEYRIRVEHRIVADPAAGDKARQIRDGIVHGTG
jgi:predicted metalloprotease with PDZ domain